eukprot:COSAG04_NODE_3087_length_3183_cov_3.280804_1_plen_284_part_01
MSSARWSRLARRTLSELAELQDGRVEGVRLVPMPSIGLEPEDRRFSVIFEADFSPRKGGDRGRRRDTQWCELELFLQPDFPESPPQLHSHTPTVKHWSISERGRVDVNKIIEWRKAISLADVLAHIRKIFVAELTEDRSGGRRSPPSPPKRATIDRLICRAMTGKWVATGRSEDARGRNQMDEQEEFVLDVRPEGYVTGYPPSVASPEDNFSLEGSVIESPRGSGRLMVRIDQTYAFSGNTTHWAAKVAKDGMALEEGRWSGSCEGLFFAERVGGPAPEPGIAT